MNKIRTTSKNSKNKYVGGGITIGVLDDMHFINCEKIIPEELSSNLEILAL